MLTSSIPQNTTHIILNIQQNIQANLNASPSAKTDVSTVYPFARNVFKLFYDICELLDDICKLLDDICKLLDDICSDQRYKDTKAFNTNRRRNGNTTEQKIKDQKKNNDVQDI